MPAITSRSRLESCDVRPAAGFIAPFASIQTTLLGGPATLAVITSRVVDPASVAVQARHGELGEAVVAGPQEDGSCCRLYPLPASGAALDVVVAGAPGALRGVLRLPGRIGRWHERPIPTPPSTPLAGRGSVAITLSVGRRRRTGTRTEGRAT